MSAPRERSVSGTRRLALALGLAAATLAGPLSPAALAQSGANVRTATFMVSVIVDNDCRIAGSNSLNFGHLAAPLDTLLPHAVGGEQYTRFSVSCSKNTRYTLYLDQGSVPGSRIATRLMAGGTPGNGDRLQYQLYLDPAYSVVWGDGSSGSAGSVGGIGSGSAQVYTVYGRILPQDMPSADLYSSIITASLTF